MTNDDKGTQNDFLALSANLFIALWGGSDDVIGLTFYRNRRVEKVGHEQRSRMTTDMRPCENALDVKGHYLTRLLLRVHLGDPSSRELSTELYRESIVCNRA
ncbi:hypothetical protein CEXT_780011 [Caerostris extrusa]|uniref:Uncharacterized protein n=1 Tax=Caerostris extrusa TaxID=172846 RepID=A0AAV4MTX1_CAEEX|nr:hypothetical protein CEXT_780011 [Caerostris extrusa]